MEKTFDVIVVGYGGAGAVAAITAHDNGAKVRVLEKMPSGGGNTRVSGGSITIPTSKEFSSYLETLCFGTTEREIIDTFVENAMNTEDWVKSLRGEVIPATALAVSYPVPHVVAGHPQVTGAQYMAKYNVKGSEAQPAARNLWAFLSANVERRDIEVITGAPAKELLKNQKGEVTGVIAEIDGKNIPIKARKAVILTCGGFENNPVLRREYLPVKDVPFLGNPGNSGDGINMVQKAGASLWHMTALVSGIGLRIPEYEAAFFISFYSPKFIIIDKYGKRYFDEATGVEPHEYWRPFSYFDAHRLEYPRIPSYAIFDEDTRRRSPIIMAGKSGSCHDVYEWSEDNMAEIKKGWIIRAKTIREMSKRLALDEATLEDTLNRYNEYCRTGKDLDFGRPRQDLSPIEPPYYAIELWPAIANTQGGPRRDKEGRVLDPDGKPIPRLYAAGEFGSIWGFMYPGGCNLTECIVFGQIAGRNAANDTEVEP